VEVRFEHNDNKWRGRALVDSGATYSLFDAEVLAFLNISDSSLRRISITTANGKVQAKFHQGLNMKFGPLDHFVPCPVMFVDDLKRRKIPNLLGRKGAFEHIQVGFDEVAQKTYMALR
jgi:hypothetical protein